MSLILRNIDSKKEISLDEGVPQVIGRGDTTGCTDKRVSRKHCQFICMPNNQLQTIALHTNPCFIMKNGTPPMIHLSKDEKIMLTQGDYFGLLPDAFWFEVILKIDSSENLNENQSCHVNNFIKEDAPQQNTNFSSPDKSKEDILSPGVKTTPSEGSKSNEPSTSNNEDSRSHFGNESSNVRTSDVDMGSSNSNIPLDLEKTKRLPLWMYEIDEPKEGKQTKAKLSKRPHSSSADESQGKKVKVNETSLSNEREPGEVITKEEEPTEVAVKEEEMDDTPDIIDVKSEPEGEKKEEKTLDTKQNNDNESVPKSKESKDSGECSKKNEKDGYESDVVEPVESNETRNSPTRRPICEYEASCYRKNPVHKKEYCHPGDADYVRPENRPQCPYGAACYRQNKLHRVEYQHPTNTPAPRPQPPSPASPASPLPPKRKPKRPKTNTRQSSDEEDDYDLEDPFINDASSDDYAPSELSSEEDEDDLTDLSQTDEENLKRLKKEAKKVIKGKKNK